MALETRLLCLDVSTNTGVCEGIIGETPTFETVRLNHHTSCHEDVFGNTVAWAAARLKLFKPDFVIIEAPIATMIHGANMRDDDARRKIKTTADASLRLIGLWAVISGIARARGIPCERANISAVRTLCFGTSRIKRNDAKKAAQDLCDLLGWKTDRYDECDAAMLFLWASYQKDPARATRIKPEWVRKLKLQREEA